ncbi:methyltransferase type 11 [Pseudohyphozyma bogoriensis]|nr:methyltransferase type 11 [Pseudohyphozyma bogoriensis]
MSASNPHTSYAKTHFSSSGGSGLYDRARPRYPPAALQQIAGYLEGTPGQVVELGAGTGIFTRGLLKEGKDEVKKLLAVEPAEGMRKGFNDKLKEAGIEGDLVECVDGAFDSIPLADGQADVVVAAQAFHWIGRDGTSAVTEIARVLKPGGKLCLIWNLEDREKAPWVAELRDLYEKYEDGTPQYRLGWWKSIFDTEIYKTSFVAPEVTDFNQIILGTEDIAVDRILSKSYITALTDKQKEDLSVEAREVIKKGTGKVWIDEKEGTFEYPYETNLWVMTRK